MSNIIVKNIEKQFGNAKVLENICFEVQEGEFISLLGPSGCGKTTTLKIIAGLIPLDKGEIFLAGRNITKEAIEKRGTVIVFQNHLLFPHLNVEQNIGFGLKMAKRSKKDIALQVEKMLKLVKLEGMNDKFPHQLSGGQQQRVALARALAVEPKVLLLDEPYSSLDRQLREEIRELIHELQKKLNITTILVTHDKEEALIYSDKIAIMLNGQIKQFGLPEELYERPVSIEVANFFGEKNYIDGCIQNKTFISSVLEFPIEKEDTENAVVMIKPEDIEIFPKDVKSLTGEIVERKYAGERIYFTIKVRDVLLKVLSHSSNDYGIGDAVSIELGTDKLLVFE